MRSTRGLQFLQARESAPFWGQSWNNLLQSIAMQKHISLISAGSVRGMRRTGFLMLYRRTQPTFSLLLEVRRALVSFWLPSRTNKLLLFQPESALTRESWSLIKHLCLPSSSPGLHSISVCICNKNGNTPNIGIYMYKNSCNINHSDGNEVLHILGEWLILQHQQCNYSISTLFTCRLLYRPH